MLGGDVHDVDKILGAALAPGSAYDDYSHEAARLYNHSEADFTSFFDSLELVPPGVTDAGVWRPERPIVDAPQKRAGWAYAGIGRVR